MGTDIHCWIEIKKNGKWTLFQPTPTDTGWSKYNNGPDAERRVCQCDWDIGRNYDLFAILADVRNGVGFAGVDTGDGFEPILSFTDGDGQLAHRRGWPTDLCPELKGEDIDHSPSWLTLSELNAYNWTDQVARKRGVVSLPDYVKWRDGKRGAPECYSGGISGPGCETVEPTRADELLRIGERTVDGWTGDHHTSSPPKGHPNTCVVVEWSETYAQAAGNFYAKHLPNLNAIAQREGVSEDDLRLVFYFDS